MKYKIVSSYTKGDSIRVIICERNGLEFEPGHCVDITNTDTGAKKPYSIASSPLDEYLKFYIKIIPSKTGVSEYVSKLKEGEYLDVGEPFGYFKPGKDVEHEKYIYIATGTGVAPFMSALDFYEHKPLYVLYGVKNNTDIIYPSSITDYTRYLCAVSRQDMGWPKRISSYYNWLPTQTPLKYTYYICGLEDMISDTTQHLIRNGVPWDKIHTEQFYYKTNN